MWVDGKRGVRRKSKAWGIFGVAWNIVVLEFSALLGLALCPEGR